MAGMDAVDFLSKARKGEPKPVYVLCGDEEFLKRQAREALVGWVLGDADPAYAVSTYPGDRAEWSTVRGELQTLPFLSPRRVVVIDQADEFVSDNRPALEKYVAKPSPGVLVLDVRSWPSNTKLAKALPDEATIVCKTPKPSQLPAWCLQRARSEYGKKLAEPAAQLLVELVEPSLGLLDQELAKLATYVGDAAGITVEDVDVLCGRSRSAETFKIFEAIGQAKPAEALAILQRLLADGEEPLALLGAFSWQLRKLAQAGRLAVQGVSVPEALREVGFGPWQVEKVEPQLRHLGRRRLEKLFDWLLEMDLGMKGNNPLPPAVQLERFVVKLAQPRKATG
jgi:DNA polymerase-3 subunit delta